MALIIDWTSRILLFVRTTLGEESAGIVFCKKKLTKSSRALSIRGSISCIFKKTDMTVSDSGRKSVTACPTIFDPTSTKTTTSARGNQHDRHEKRQTRRADQGPTLPRRKVVLKSLISRMMQRIVRVLVNVSKIHHDHSYLCRQEQVIHEESMVSTSGSGGPPLDKPVTADEVEYLITELEECRKKAKILEENSYFFHHWKIFEFLFLKDTIAAKAVFDA